MASSTTATSRDTPAPFAKAKIALSGVSETMLVTLTGRAKDAAKPNPVLGDNWARHVLDQLDYACPRTLWDDGFFMCVLLRAGLLDAWTAEFLDSHPEATVLHLACGLDSRALRLAWGPRVRWVDVDMPDVVELRRKVLPSPAGDYRLVASSVTDDAWLDDIPADRPTIVIMEGLLPYLEPAEGKRLLQRICDRFPSGQIVFDTIGALLLRMQAINRPIARTGARMHFAMDEAAELETVHPKLRSTSVVRIWQLPGTEIFPWYLRFSLWIYSWLPGFRTMGSYWRYEF